MGVADFAMRTREKSIIHLLAVLLCLFLPSGFVLAEPPQPGLEENQKPETAIHITADRLESDHKMSLVEFSGNVVATEADVVMRADRMKVFYKTGEGASPGPGTIHKIISEGNVKIVFDNKTKTAEADKAVYLAEQKVLELSGGDPKVWSGKNIVRGNKITLFQAENRSLVEGGDSNQVEATLYVKEGSGLTE